MYTNDFEPHDTFVDPFFTPNSPEDESGRSISTHPRKRRVLDDQELSWMRFHEARISQQLCKTLDEADTTLAIVSRPGENLNKHRFVTARPLYTHMGFAIKSMGKWFVDHLLNTHGGTTCHLYRQNLIDFFRDDPFEYRVGVIIPSTRLQRRIRETLLSPVREKLYNRQYSRVAYPYSCKYQSSNQWLLEVIGSAQSTSENRAHIQQYVCERGFQPTVLKLNLGLQIGARLMSPNTRFDDQPSQQRLRGNLKFVMEPSLRDYLERTDPVVKKAVLKLGSTNDVVTPHSLPIAA